MEKNRTLDLTLPHTRAWYVKTAGGQTSIQQCLPLWQILCKMRGIKSVTGIPHDQQRLVSAGKQLEACQKRRIRQFHIIEAVCGPAQGGYGECVRDKGSARAVECLPLLQTFLDCAERALDEKSTAVGVAVAVWRPVLT